MWAITSPPWENPWHITSVESCRLLCYSVQGFQVDVDTFACEQVALRTDNIPIAVIASLQVDHGHTFTPHLVPQLGCQSSSRFKSPGFPSCSVFCSYKRMFLKVSSLAVQMITHPREYPTLYLCICWNLLWLSVLEGKRIKALARRVFHLLKDISVNQRLFSNINLCPAYFI